MTSYRDLGRLIQRSRLARDMSRKELGQAARLSYEEIGHIERGERRPKPEGLARLAKALDADYLALAQAAGYAPLPIGELTITVEDREQAAWLRLFANRFNADELEALYGFGVTWQPRSVAVEAEDAVQEQRRGA